MTDKNPPPPPRKKSIKETVADSMKPTKRAAPPPPPPPPPPLPAPPSPIQSAKEELPSPIQSPKEDLKPEVFRLDILNKIEELMGIYCNAMSRVDDPHTSTIRWKIDLRDLSDITENKDKALAVLKELGVKLTTEDDKNNRVSFSTAKFSLKDYHEVLKQYEKIKKRIQVEQDDFQVKIDNAGTIKDLIAVLRTQQTEKKDMLGNFNKAISIELQIEALEHFPNSPPSGSGAKITEHYGLLEKVQKLKPDPELPKPKF